ncbi:unnamed protein product [Dibothriocephalus latus]|uniref:SCP domain-containing protein n=1 Tax=Dibothriocephalus latus TaxID=60516 RepID=A0A3P6QP99_DIBLA|nr:unnamed protein product [Dibothriocephalus latus]
MVGFGMAYSSDKHTIYIVAQYHPQGNWEHRVVENVPEPLAWKTAAKESNLGKALQGGEKGRPDGFRGRFKTIELQSLVKDG